MRRVTLCLTACFAATRVAAQTPAPGIAVVNLRFDGQYANVPEPSDTSVAAAATSRLRATLRASELVTLVDSGLTAAAVAAAEADGNLCDRVCARSVARGLGARWVTTGTVRKTSHLVWILVADLVDVTSGKTILADSYELKGDAARMAPAGAHVFAQRIERAVTGERRAAVDP